MYEDSSNRAGEPRTPCTPTIVDYVGNTSLPSPITDIALSVKPTDSEIVGGLLRHNTEIAPRNYGRLHERGEDADEYVKSDEQLFSAIRGWMIQMEENPNIIGFMPHVLSYVATLLDRAPREVSIESDADSQLATIRHLANIFHLINELFEFVKNQSSKNEFWKMISRRIDHDTKAAANRAETGLISALSSEDSDSFDDNDLSLINSRLGITLDILRHLLMVNSAMLSKKPTHTEFDPNKVANSAVTYFHRQSKFGITNDSEGLLPGLGEIPIIDRQICVVCPSDQKCLGDENAFFYSIFFAMQNAFNVACNRDEKKISSADANIGFLINISVGADSILVEVFNTNTRIPIDSHRAAIHKHLKGVVDQKRSLSLPLTNLEEVAALTQSDDLKGFDGHSISFSLNNPDITLRDGGTGLGAFVAESVIKMSDGAMRIAEWESDTQSGVVTSSLFPHGGRNRVDRSRNVCARLVQMARDGSSILGNVIKAEIKREKSVPHYMDPNYKEVA